jgi:hypothetical protein
LDARASVVSSNGRSVRRQAQQHADNAALLRLPVVEYLALPRRERKRRLQAARHLAGRPGEERRTDA